MFEIVVAPPSPDGIGAFARAARLIGGVLLLALGCFVAWIMTVALFHEVQGGDFFGMNVCLLVVIFGILLARDGLYYATGFRIQLTRDEKPEVD